MHVNVQLQGKMACPICWKPHLLQIYHGGILLHQILKLDNKFCPGNIGGAQVFHGKNGRICTAVPGRRRYGVISDQLRRRVDSPVINAAVVRAHIPQDHTGVYPGRHHLHGWLYQMILGRAILITFSQSSIGAARTGF